MEANLKSAYFGGGCFWCTEATFKMIKGVARVVPGYSGGITVNPSYTEVSTGETMHAEVVKIDYDPNIISFRDLLEIFFATHDPTTLNKQGADIGTQYRSIILFDNIQDKEIASKFIEILVKENIFQNKIVTEIKPLSAFYEAEEYHHNYFEKHPNSQYCQIVINPKLEKLKKRFKEYLK